MPRDYAGVMANANPLVGREYERSLLVDLLGRMRGERPGVIFITGEAGIGKSRLIDETLAVLSRPILRGDAAAGSVSPYAPLIQVIRAYSRDHRDALIGLPLTKHLSLLVPELGDGQDETDPLTLRTAICDVAAAAGDAGSIVVLEDLHWADGGTLEVLLELARVPERSDLSIVATYRNDELPRLHRLRSARSELKRAGRVQEIVLQPLTRQDAYRLMEEVAGSSLPEDVRQRIFTRSDGIPFFVEELASSIALDAQASRSTEVEDGEPPETLRDAIRLRTSMLDAPVTEVLEVMATAGFSIDLPLLAALVDPDSVTRLIEHGWLVEVEGPTVSFRHALVRDAIYADIPWLRRRERHRFLAEALELRGAAPEDVALHWLAAREPLRARAPLLQAARSFCSVHAYRDARALLQTALGEWESDGVDPERLCALELQARCTELSGDRDVAVGMWQEVSKARGELDDAEGLARAQRRLATLLEMRGDWDDAVAARAAAAAGFGACAQPAEAAIERLAAASHLVTAGALNSALALVQQAGTDVEASGHGELRLRVLSLEGEIRAKLGQPAGLTMARNALSLALSEEYAAPAAEAYYRLASVLEHGADYAGAVDAYESAFAFCKSRGIEGMGEVCLACMTPVMRHVGRWKEAIEVCRNVIRDGDAPAVARNVATGELGLIHGIKGNATSARRLLAPALSFARANDIFGLIIECSWGLAMVQVLEGKSVDASTTAAELVESCRRREEWHYSLSAMRWCSTWFSEQRNETGLLAAVDVLTRAAARTGSQEAQAALAHGLVEIALMHGEDQRGFVQAEQALNLLERISAPYEVAEMRARCAAALLEAGRRDAALGILTASYRTAKKLGARTLAHRIVRQFEALGEPIEPHLGRRAGGQAERAGLSRRELDVLRHVARGRTNKEIAEALFLSTRTVDMHLRNILMKLSCRSRSEAVRRAAELGLLADAHPGDTA
jgi:DNA-binding CsgD family transcriptional regulator